MAESSVLGMPLAYTIEEESANTETDYPAINLRDPNVFRPWRTTDMTDAYVVLDTGVADPLVNYILLPYAKHGKDIKIQVRTAAAAAGLLGASPSLAGLVNDSGQIDGVPNATDAAVQLKVARHRYVTPQLWHTATPGDWPVVIHERYIRIDIDDSVASFVEIGRCVLCNAYQFPNNPQYGGAPVQWQQKTNRVVTPTGRRVGLRGARLRTTSWQYDASGDEYRETFQAFVEERGTDRDIIYSWDPTELHAHFSTFLGMAEEPFKTQLPFYEGFMTSFKITEVADPLL